MARNPGNDPLNEALAAWRGSAPEERFSADARAEILERAHPTHQEQDFSRLAQLFVPVAKIAYAAAVPALVLALTVGWLSGTPAPESSQVRIESSKVNGRAVFRIANGGKAHKVYRSTNPRNSGEKELVPTTDDTFTDRLYETSGVVYYRID